MTLEKATVLSGFMLRKTVYANNDLSYFRDYMSGCEFMNGALDFISTSEGKLVPDAMDYFEYILILKSNETFKRFIFNRVKNCN